MASRWVFQKYSLHPRSESLMNFLPSTSSNCPEGGQAFLNRLQLIYVHLFYIISSVNHFFNKILSNIITCYFLISFSTSSSLLRLLPLSPTLLPRLYVSHLSSLEICSSSLCSVDDLSLHFHAHGTGQQTCLVPKFLGNNNNIPMWI